jgi:hypothetical protein
LFFRLKNASYISRPSTLELNRSAGMPARGAWMRHGDPVYQRDPFSNVPIT